MLLTLSVQVRTHPEALIKIFSLLLIFPLQSVKLWLLKSGLFRTKQKHID